jgi:hypothetical protein
MNKNFEQNQINNIVNKFDKNEEKFLDLPQIEKGLPFNERLNELFEKSVFVESEDGKKYILQNGTRIAVIADVNGVQIPFYQSSGGTGGKISGEWYPFFGNAGAWLIKGNIEDLKRGYGIAELKEMMDYLNTNLPEYLYNNLLTDEQKKSFSNSTWKRQVGKIQSVKDKNPEFILDPDEAGEYMAKILGYKLSDAPRDGSDPKRSEFLEKILDSIKTKLDIFKKF